MEVPMPNNRPPSLVDILGLDAPGPTLVPEPPPDPEPHPGVKAKVFGEGAFIFSPGDDYSSTRFLQFLAGRLLRVSYWDAVNLELVKDKVIVVEGMLMAVFGCDMQLVIVDGDCRYMVDQHGANQVLSLNFGQVLSIEVIIPKKADTGEEA